MKPPPPAACSALPLTSSGILQGCNRRIKYKQGSASRPRGERRVGGPSREPQQGLIYRRGAIGAATGASSKNQAVHKSQLSDKQTAPSPGMGGELKTTGMTWQEIAHVSLLHHFGKGCEGGSKHPPSWQRDPKTLHVQGPQPLTLVAHRPPTFNPQRWGHILNTRAR